MSLKKLSAAFVVVLLMVVAAPKAASATTIGFTCITNNTGNCGALSGDYTGEVTVSGNTLTATISVAPGGLGSIAELYVDFPDAFAFTFLPPFIESAGVDWELGANPPQLPSENNAIPAFNSDFASQASGDTSTGIQAGEFLTVKFTTVPDIGDLNTLLASGGLRFGIHVRDVDGETSEALVSFCAISECGERSEDPPEVVPEPATMLLLGTGLLAAARTARRRKTS